MSGDGTSRRLFEAVAGGARRSGPPDALATALAWLAELDQRAGRRSRAPDTATEALRRAEWSRRVLHEARADVGPVVHALAARALLALAETDHAVALDGLDQVARVSGARGTADEALRRWGADHVEAAAGAGARERASEVMRSLTACAAAADTPELDAVVFRAAGIVAGEADMDLLFQEAIEVHASRPDPFEWARTRLCYGERLRRAARSDEAAGQLSAALTTFERLGARRWAARCLAGGAARP